MIRTLADLVASSCVEVFIENFIAKTRWLGRTNSPHRAGPLLPWSEIDRLIANGAVPAEQLKVIVNRNEVERRVYRNANTGSVRADAFQGLVSQGATFVIIGISNLVPAIAELVTAMERHLGQRVNANCYLSFGRHSAFLSHYDDHDVVILQVHGSKHWRCYGVDLAFPIHGTHTSALNTPVWEDVIGPGDVLYVPRGDVHAAIPVQRPSVHLTLGIIETTGVDFSRWLAKRAEDVEILRSGLERSAPTQQRHAKESDIKRALHELIDATPIADFLSDDDSKRTPRSVAAFDFAQRLGPDSILVSALRRRIDLQLSDPDEFKIEIGGEQIRLSQLARQLLSAVTEQDRVTLGSLAASVGKDANDREIIDSLDDLARQALIYIAS